MIAIAYVLLDVTDGKLGEVAKVLHVMPGVVMTHILEGPPDIIIVVEAADRGKLAEFTIQALASVEDMTEAIRLLPVQDNLNTKAVLKPFPG